MRPLTSDDNPGSCSTFRGRVPVTAALVLVTGIGPWAVDTYVAALPELKTSLHTTAAVAQLTVTAFIIGGAVGQLVLGPLSDSRGRRNLLFGGAAAFAAMSLVCALAPTGPLLVAARFVQGIASGCGAAVGRAVVGDVYRGAEAAKRYGTLAAIIFLGPVIAPAIGGVILTVGSWRTIFAILAGAGLVMILAVGLGIPETLPPAARHGQGLRDTTVRMTDLMGDWTFMRHVSVLCLTTAGFFTYIGGSSFVLETVYGISQTTYAAVFATNAAAMAITSGVFRVVVTRVGAARLRTIGLSVATAASLGLVATGLAERHALPPLAVPWALLSCVTAGMGLVLPATTTLAQEAGRRARGTASALQGGLQFFVGALVTPLTGFVGYTSMLPMALLMDGFFLAAIVLLLGSGHPRGGAGVGVPSAASAASTSSRLIPRR
jgi:DHA1 family bicyclomycin/chloramphenicol resistance-like MFS transporter